MNLQPVRLVLLAFGTLCSAIAIAQTPIEFEYTGEVELYVVPSCVSQLEIALEGAAGGGPNGGNGSTVTGILDVVEGQVLEIRVGGQGACPGAGFNGGGGGGAAGGANAGCGGGGASDIRIGGSALADRVAVAAGGGGMGGGNTDADAGDAGCNSGGDGDSPFGQGGSGATQNSGGPGGPPWIGSGNNGSSGGLGNGGAGATDPCYNVGPGGGGGGGYYGGGGGGSDCFASGTLGGGGGGGGSSLTPAGFTCTGGNVSGNGSIVITPIGGVGMVVEPTAPQFCEGDSLFLTLSGADNYDWFEADGLTVIDGPNVLVNPLETTIYSVVASNEECIDTVDVTVTVIPYPTLTVDPVYVTTCNEPVSLSATGAFQLQWTPNESLVGNGFGPFQTANPTETTVYTVVGTNSGCSSEATVTVAYQLEVESTEYYCEGGSYSLPDGSEVNEEGTYIAEYVSVEGCDSIVTVNLFEQSTYDFQMPVQLCAGETFTLPDGTIIDEPGTFPVVLETTLAQCDSVITTVVSMLQPFETENTLALCEGEPVTLGDGTVVTEEGIYTVVLSSETNGCDSTVTSNVIYQPNYDMAVSLSECDDGSYLFPDGNLPTSSGVFNFDLQTTLGCDSSVTIDLTLNPAYDISYAAAICEGELYNMPDGTAITAAGPYTSVLTTSAGCDSTITVQLTVNPLPAVSSGAEDSYCLYDGNIELTPSPAGGDLSGDLLSGTTLQHSGATPGNYEVSYSITDGNGCTNVDLVEYVLATPIEPSFDFQMICNELELISLVNDPNEAYGYEWFLENELVAIFSNPTYYFDETGTFEMGLAVTDEYGCTYSTVQDVYLQNALNLEGFFVPNVFTPNGDDFNDTFIIPSAVSACLNYNVDIFNRWGQLVYTMTPLTSAFAGKDEAGNELPEGVYYYTMEIIEYPCSDTPELQPFCSGTISLFRQ